MSTKKVTLEEFREMCEFLFPSKGELTRQELRRVSNEYNCSVPSKIWGWKTTDVRPVRYSIFEVKREVEEASQSCCDRYSTFVPNKNEYFVSHGTNYKLIDSIVETMDFFPLYIYGVSGLGKTLQVEQACAAHKRPFFRCQITKDTTNDDLIGCYSLIDGNTVWQDGPVLMAYRSGGVLLLDEIDLNSSLMMLQLVLENRPILVTQTGELVYPKKGFNVFATGNSKGDGTDSRFVGTTVLNDAFLERFVSIVEQKIPTRAVEEKIMRKYMSVEGISLDEDVYENFVRWIEYVRDAYKEENTSVYISSRRIQYILKVYKLTGNFTKSMEIALSRYADEERDSFMMMWKALHSERRE